jgi:PAS domain S-box-containing protein
MFAARFRALLDSPAQGIIEVDSTGVIRLVSRHAETIFGYDHRELLGQSIEVLVPQRVRHIHAEERMNYSEWPQSRSMGRGIDLTGRRRDGSEVPVEISLTNMRAGDGTRTISMITDITQRVEMEEHNRQTHKMEALGQLAATVAYQLNTLLSVISRHTGLALDRCDGNEALRSSMEELSTTAAKANSLAQQLHIFSGSHVVEPVWFDPNARLSQMYRYLLGFVGDRIDLELALGEDLGELLADPWQWDQVIVTLVQNAREAMPEGGRLRIETSSAEVDENENHWCLAVSPGMYVMLTVADTGVGMRPEVQDRMFEPFFTTKPSGDRAGTGLSIVYGILMAAGGSILASSKPNEGTTFQVIFPRLPATPGGRDGGEGPSDMK